MFELSAHAIDHFLCSVRNSLNIANYRVIYNLTILYLFGQSCPVFLVGNKLELALYCTVVYACRDSRPTCSVQYSILYHDTPKTRELLSRVYKRLHCAVLGHDVQHLCCYVLMFTTSTEQPALEYPPSW